MIVTTMPCRMCGNRSVVHDVDALGYVRWSELGENIQDVLPGLDADQRELLMTGTHAHCWERMWAGVDA
jgi:tRNA(Arg) A34 adenosine deaminase TadA